MKKAKKVPAAPLTSHQVVLKATEVLKRLQVIEEYEEIKPSSTAGKIIKMVRNNLA